MSVMTHRTGGGGAASLAGLPFLLFGLGFTGLGVFLGFTQQTATTGEPPLAAVVPFVAFGLLFAAIGASIVFGRSGVDFDADRRRLVTWWSLLGVRLRSREQDVPPGALVTIDREVRRGSKSSYTVFPVRIGPEGGQAPDASPSGALDVGAPREHAEARRLAEGLGKAFRADVLDRTLQPPSRRRADQLDASLRERWRDAPPPLPAAPPSPRCTHRVEGRRVIVDVPATFPFAVPLVGAGVGCFGLIFVVPVVGFMLAAGGGAEALYPLPIVGVWLLVAWASLRDVVRGARRWASPVRLELSRDAVVVTWLACGERVEVPTDELEEVGWAHRREETGLGQLGGRLLLLGDARTVDVVVPLGPEERDWLADLIVFVAAAGPPSP